MRRRNQAAQKQIRRRKHSYPDSESENGQKDKGNRADKNAVITQSNSWTGVASVFTYIESHPQLPHILSFYAQLLLNLFLVFSCMYILYSFWSTIVSDVDKRSEEAVTAALADMALCAKNYRDNGCEDRRAPALEQVCLGWEKCMAKDPKSVGRARVSAHTFAEIFNSFIEPISYKAMVCHPFVVSHTFCVWIMLTKHTRYSLSSSSSLPSSSPTLPLASSAIKCIRMLTCTIHRLRRPHSAILATGYSLANTLHTTMGVFHHCSHHGSSRWV